MVDPATYAPSRSYAPSPVPGSYAASAARYAPSAAPTPVPAPRPTAGPTTAAPSSVAPTPSFRLEAGQCYDRVGVRDAAAVDLYCDQHDPADCARLFVADCVAYCDGKQQVMALTSDRHGALVECYCATARPQSCLRVAGYGTAVAVADLNGQGAFGGVCVLADADVWLSRACDDHAHHRPDDDDPYAPTYGPTRRPTYTPTPGDARASASRPELEPAARAARRGSSSAAIAAAGLLGAAVLGLAALLLGRWRDRRRHRHIAETMASAADFVPLDDHRRVELVASRRDFV